MNKVTFNLSLCFVSFFFVPPRWSCIYPKCLIKLCIQYFMHTLTLIIGARKNKLTWTQQIKNRGREKQCGWDDSGKSDTVKGPKPPALESTERKGASDMCPTQSSSGKASYSGLSSLLIPASPGLMCPPKKEVKEKFSLYLMSHAK